MGNRLSVLVVADPRAEQKIPRGWIEAAGFDYVGQRNTAETALLAIWQRKPEVLIIDAWLGAGSRGQEVLDGLVDLGADYRPIIVALDPVIPNRFILSRGPQLEENLRTVLGKVKSLLEEA